MSAPLLLHNYILDTSKIGLRKTDWLVQLFTARKAVRFRISVQTDPLPTLATLPFNKSQVHHLTALYNWCMQGSLFWKYSFMAVMVPLRVWNVVYTRNSPSPLSSKPAAYIPAALMTSRAVSYPQCRLKLKPERRSAFIGQKPATVWKSAFKKSACGRGKGRVKSHWSSD